MGIHSLYLKAHYTKGHLSYVIAGLDPAIQGNKLMCLRPWIHGSPLRYARG